jgi:hypothetical protein
MVYAIANRARNAGKPTQAESTSDSQPVDPENRQPPSAETSGTTQVGPPIKWFYSINTSRLDDTPGAIARLEAEDEITGWLNQKHTPELFVRCKEGEIDVYINVGMAATVEYGYGSHTVRLRLDDARPFRERWSQSTDNEALFAPRAASLARKIAAARTLLFEFTPFNASPQTVEFDVQGLDKFLPGIEAACQSKPGRKRR